MIGIESVKVHNQFLHSFSTYGEYEDITRPSIFAGYTPEFAPSDFLPVGPVKPYFIVAHDCYIAEVYWTSNKIENIISERFFKIPAVEYIFFSIENDLIEIGTVINKYDKEIAKTIYSAEYDILETFKDYYFDFIIIYREDRKINDICPSESVIIRR
jgi:hypothetical protein